ncbi:MAG TPA: zf-HC2 domain-containing protein [Thermoanaerobaculia bacterium]
MLCNEVKRVVYFFLDGSVSDSKKQALARHFDDCPDCDARMRIQKRIRDFVHRRLSPVTAPDKLKIRLTRSIRAFRTEWSASGASE